ncbi:hypothetical protein [Nonomuraea sp. NPDC049784]|uniref:hypothetical protein n=1 Tax=Nonomuraea sp. NPDC049784 TaxID=3154361 RepID=UPI0033DF8E99
MSRHTIPTPPGSPEGRTITVGWDAPLATFWATAIDPATSDDEEEAEIFSLGDTPCELPTVESLDTVLRAHGVELPFPTAAAIAMDKANEGESFVGRPGYQIITEMMRSHVPADQQARIDAALEGGAQ